MASKQPPAVLEVEDSPQGALTPTGLDSSACGEGVSEAAKACGRHKIDFDAVEADIAQQAPIVWEKLEMADAAEAVQAKLETQIAAASKSVPAPDLEGAEPESPEETLWEKAVESGKFESAALSAPPSTGL